jgi:solute carrier family 25 phosphate transporter 23/24/25/41
MPAPATSPLPGAAAQRASHALHWEEQEDASTPAAFMQDNAQFERQTRQIFDRLDRDGDGGLDREELLYRMKELGVPTSPAALDRWFELSDRDHSASVSFEEFLQFRLGRRDQIRSLWDRMRGSDKGLTSAAMMVGLRELGIKAADEEIRQQVSMLDSSGDGVISFADFCSWLVLLPDVNPRAVFDDFARIGYHDDAHGEYTVPRPQPSGMTASAIATKLLCGGIAGMVSRTATAPVDRLKIMCQAAPAGGTPPGLSVLVRTVFAEGGVRAFFRGNGANCVKIAPETGVKFVAFDLLKGAIAADPHNVTVTERFAAGGLAGASAQCAIYPLEIAKTRLALARPGTYGGLASCLRTVQGTEGVRAL